jgi:hypothetical protein
MKYLIAVKLRGVYRAEIYEFNKKKDRSRFYNDIKGYENVKDVAFSQMEG